MVKRRSVFLLVFGSVLSLGTNAVEVQVGAVQSYFNPTPCQGLNQVDLTHENLEPDSAFLFYAESGTVPAECVNPFGVDLGGKGCASYFKSTELGSANYFSHVVGPALSGEVLFFVLSVRYDGGDDYSYAISESFHSMEFGSDSCAQPSGTKISGNFRKWDFVELSFDGPLCDENDDAVCGNPFTDYRLRVTFIPESGIANQKTVEGFFDADGVGGTGVGDQWKVRFSPDEEGEWAYFATFYSGNEIVTLPPDSGLQERSIHGKSGSFQIHPQVDHAPGFLSEGRLEYVGEHYLKHRDGGYFIKTGTDSPENILGYAGFDNTYNQNGGITAQGLPDQIHRFEPHVQHFQAGDPYFVADTTYQCSHGAGTQCNSRGLIGAINYLSQEEVNSMYFVTINLQGDGREVYPFVEATSLPDTKLHYDVSKLRQWGVVFNHMQRRGVMSHFVLQETEIDNYFDHGLLGLERKTYYREIIARFGHLLATKWNFGEEIDTSVSLISQYADYVASIYPYGQPTMGFHTHWIDDWQIDYSPYQQAESDLNLNISSIQGHMNWVKDLVEFWYHETDSWNGNKWVIDIDELGSSSLQATLSSQEENRKRALYDVLFNGGNIEWYFGYYPLWDGGGDLATEDFSTRSYMWKYQRIARQLMQGTDGGPGIRYWEMTPIKEDAGVTPLVGNLSGSYGGPEVFCHYESSENVCQGDIVVYYPVASSSANNLRTGSIRLMPGNYQKYWLNPRTGARSSPVNFSISLPSLSHVVGSHPDDPDVSDISDEDWVLVVYQGS